MQVVRFRAEHLALLDLQDAQAHLSPLIASPDYARSLESTGGFTGLIDGVVVASAGCLEMWQGRAVVWALLSKHAGQHMRPLHRAVAGYIEASKHRRLEAWVDEGFEAGARWLTMLGFTQETPQAMRGFRPDGGACYLYSRVQ